MKIDIPQNVTSIDYCAFNDCNNLECVNLGNDVKSIGDGAFWNCFNLRDFNIPSSVTLIGYGAFGYCTSFTSLVIPKGVTSIERHTFVGCTNLMDVTIYPGITSIDHNAFYNCVSLKNFYCYAAEIPEVTNDAFEHSSISDATLYVPEATIDNYKNTVPWSDFKEILAIEDAQEGMKLIYGPAAGTNGSVPVYSLSGQRLFDKSALGIHIKQGKKMIVK